MASPSVVESESTARTLDLSLYGRDLDQVIGGQKRIPRVFQRRKEIERLIEEVPDVPGRFAV